MANSIKTSSTRYSQRDTAGNHQLAQALNDGNPSGVYQTITPTNAESPLVNVIDPEVTRVRLGANVNDTDDFVVLPPIASVPSGQRITIIAGAANCEVRTPAGSNTKINNQDSDGTKEYLLTATQIHYFTKIDDTIGWMGNGYTAIGAVVTAVVPD